MCPWPRFQAAMLDEDSLVVTYEAWRGEPRGKHRKAGDAGTAAAIASIAILRRRLPDRHRHPRRPAARVHRLRLCIDACNGVMKRSACRRT
jgi:polyferredoxin